VALAVVDRKGEQTEPLRLRDCGGRVRVQAAAQQYYGSHLMDRGLRDWVNPVVARSAFANLPIRQLTN
jgi:hypothetical protein